MERRRRRVLGLVAALSIAAAACGSGSSSATPTALPTESAASASDPRLLTGGLGANLDKLGSYRFTEMIYSGSDASSIGSPASASVSSASSSSAGPAGTSAHRVEGTVVNGAGKSIAISIAGVRYVVIGPSAWSSVDGDVWASVDDQPDVLTLLPAAYYSLWFDPHVSGFSAVAEETHNGVACTRFSGSDALGNLYATMTGATFQADLWVARDGGYPVGGRYLVPSGGHVSGFSFEITNVNDAANTVAAPSNVVALPS